MPKNTVDPAKVLAVRQLEMPDGSDEVRLEIDIPTQSTRDDEERHLIKGMWFCGFRIVRAGDVVAQGDGIGTDALEAIVTAIPSLRAAYAKTGFTARWNEFLSGTGLPAFIPQGFGIEFDEHVERLVHTAVEARALELEEEYRQPRKG